MGSIITTVSLPPKLHDKAKKHHLSFSKVLQNALTEEISRMEGKNAEKIAEVLQVKEKTLRESKFDDKWEALKFRDRPLANAIWCFCSQSYVFKERERADQLKEAIELFERAEKQNQLRVKVMGEFHKVMKRRYFRGKKNESSTA